MNRKNCYRQSRDNEQGQRVPHHAPAHHRHVLQTRFEQDDESGRVARVARQDPHIHPVKVRLVIGDDDEPIGKVYALHVPLVISLDQVG